MPSKCGLFSSPIDSRDWCSNFFPKISSRIQENSRFPETRLGDARINALHGRRGSTLQSPSARSYFDGDGGGRDPHPVRGNPSKAWLAVATRDDMPGIVDLQELRIVFRIEYGCGPRQMEKMRSRTFFA